MGPQVDGADVRTRQVALPVALLVLALLVLALLVLALLAAATAVVLLWAGGWSDLVADDVGWGVGLLLWSLSPFVAGAAVVVAVSRSLPRGGPALALGVAVLAVLTVLALGSSVTSESSTTALVFVFLPFYQGIVVALTAGAAAVLHALRARRSRTADLRAA